MAGAGVRGGMSYGTTDELAATVASDMVHVHDFHATILHLLAWTIPSYVPTRRKRLSTYRRSREHRAIDLIVK